MSIALRGLDPAIRPAAQWCLDVAAYYRIPVTVTSGLRTWADQSRLRNQYEECLRKGETVAPGNANPACRFPANAPGDSAHQYGLAWDSYVPPEWRDFWTRVREYVGFRVPSHDWVHAEYPDWRAYV